MSTPAARAAALIEKRGLDAFEQEDDALYDIVHDAFSAKASRINNRGRTEQLKHAGLTDQEAGWTSDEDLDETVHDVFSAKASEANNGGVETQLEALFELGWSESEIEGKVFDDATPELG